MSKISLRPEYQLPMVREIAAAYQHGAQGVMLRCPTGGGKTRTASYIVDRYVSTDRQVLWLVDQEELLDQAAMTFAGFGIEHHLVCASKTERAIKAHQFLELGRSFVKPGARAVIASIQTLVRRLEVVSPWLDPFQIIADEADLSLAATWRRVIGHWPKARLLGLTATPIRMDRQSFLRAEGGLYDVMVQGPSEGDLIRMGFLCSYDAYRPPVELLEGVADLSKMRGDDYDPQELEKELDAPKIYGDVVSHYRSLSDGKPAIAFCPTVASAEKFAQAFRDGGYRAQALDGMTDDGVRRRAVKQLGSGEIDVLTGVGLLVKGVDIPYATTAIWLRRTKSLRIFLQGTGRVLRPHPDKPKAIILDCVGVVQEHGLPHFEREWSLSPPDRKASKRAANDNEEPDSKVSQCPQCYSVHEPAPVCPKCGHTYPPKERREAVQVDAELVKVSESEEERWKRQKRILQGQAKTEAELRAQGKSLTEARAIIKYREQKAALVGEVMDGVNRVRTETGEGPFSAFGVTMGDIGRMKPKGLKDLLEKIRARLGQDEFKIGLVGS